MIEQRVIELGAGTGVCGLAASLLNAKNVLITDMKDFVPLMEKNIIENKAVIGNRKVEALEVDWRQFCQEEDPENAFEIDGNLRSKLLQGFDVILVSDCIYYEPAIQWLVSCLDALMGPKTKMLMSLELRPEKMDMTKNFFRKLKEKKFQLQLETDIPEQFKCDEIQIWSAIKS